MPARTEANLFKASRGLPSTSTRLADSGKAGLILFALSSLRADMADWDTELSAFLQPFLAQRGHKKRQMCLFTSPGSLVTVWLSVQK